MINKLKYLIYPITLLGAELFSAYYSLLGVEQDEGSSTYLLFMLGLFVLSMFFVTIDYCTHWRKINKKILLVPFLFFICYFIDISFEQHSSEWTSKSFYFFLFFSVPAMLIASVLTGTNNTSRIYKNLEILMLFLAVGMIATLPKMLIFGDIIKGYNNISYQSALAFGYLYYGIFTKREDRYSFFRMKAYKILCVVFCTLLALTSLCSGGRGGVVLLFVLMAIVSLMYVEKRNILKVFFIVVPLLVVFVFILATSIEGSVYGEVLQRGTDRAFSYISKSGIDMSQTSNRDEAYESAIINIQKNPITGYGIFHTIGEFGYPHNFFLEVLEQGGVLYFFMWIFVIIKAISRCSHIVKRNKELDFLIPIFLYPCIMLLFSGSYLMCGSFWFFIISMFTNSRLKRIF